MNNKRKAVSFTLQQRFSSSKAKSFENSIFKMAEKLEKEVLEGSVEEIYEYYAYEKVGQLLTCTDDEISKVLDDISSCRIGKDAYYRREFDNKRPESKDPQIRSGVFPCLTKGCRSRHTKETVFRMEQRRSGDESMSAIVSCRVCKREYTL